MKFSGSDISAYQRCKLMWDWTSQNRRNLEPYAASVPLMLGKYVHRALEWYYRNGLDPAEGFLKALEEALTAGEVTGASQDVLNDVATTGHKMMDDYRDYWNWVDNNQPEKSIRVLVTEQEIEVPLEGTPHKFIGTMDGLCLDYWDRLWVLEHKTYKNQPPVDGWMMSPQASGYTWAAQQLIHFGYQPWMDRGIRKGQHVHGVLYNGIRKPLKTPKPLEDMYQRTFVRRTIDQMVQWEDDLRLVVAEMSRKNVPIYPNPTNSCRWDCAFFDACMLRTVGQDAEPVLASAFRSRPPRGAVYAEE